MIEVITKTIVRLGGKEAKMGLRLSALTVLAVAGVTITTIWTRKR